MWVHLSGSKAGHWQDAATGEFGDALDLLAACRHRGDLKAAYTAGLAWLGWTADALPPPSPVIPARRAGADRDREAKKRAYALTVWLSAQSAIVHTPVDDYLRGRAIDLAQLGRQPRALRYHPDLWHPDTRRAWPAMVAAISGPDGAHIATHRTFLERAGGGYIKLRAPNPKLVLGAYAAGSIRVARGASQRPLKDARPDEPVIIGEGIETCLSIARACPEFRVLCAVSLSNMAMVWLPDQVRLVVLAADNDVKPAARQALQRAINRHLDASREVRIARARQGSDFNDVLAGAA